VNELAEQYGEDVIVIGGVAVYMHLVAAAVRELPVEYTHDADMYIAFAAWTDFRDQYEVVVNRRLGKHQTIIHGIEVDLYLERTHQLRVSYQDLAMAASTISNVRVASLEHLLLLKLSAFANRRGSAHGEKDQRDIVKLLVLLEHTKPYYVLAQADDEDMDLMDSILKSHAFMQLTAGNAHQASQLRARARIFFERVKG